MGDSYRYTRTITTSQSISSGILHALSVKTLYQKLFQYYLVPYGCNIYRVHIMEEFPWPSVFKFMARCHPVSISLYIEQPHIYLYHCITNNSSSGRSPTAAGDHADYLPKIRLYDFSTSFLLQFISGGINKSHKPHPWPGYATIKLKKSCYFLSILAHQLHSVHF